MTWTANVIDKEVPKVGELRVTVRYTDGVRTVDEIYRSLGDPGPLWVEQCVTNKLTALEAQDRYVVVVGPVTPLPVTPLDAARQTFMENVLRLQRIWALFVQTEIIPKTDPSLVALQDAIRADLGKYLDTI